MDTPADRLTGIETLAGLMHDAKGQGAQAVVARQQLVLTYYGAAYRYLLAVLHQEEAAQELAQQFAIRLMQGEYVKQADPDKGKFRLYLKRALRNLAMDYHRRAKGPQALPDDSGLWSPNEPEEAHAEDEAFYTSLREEMVAAVWNDLANWERSSNTPYHTVLLLKTEHPELRSADLATQLSRQLHKEFTAENVRKIISRAREKFAELLVQRVEQTLQIAEQEQVEEALVELRLLEYCRSALANRKRS